ncbi:amidohydrolase family protein [Ruania zhangjianzhongii]|uniref:amidohydrolase family protein n=1 Tax=Ruania zhangjianzhongii TaxID=2603206 RepID=UPI0011CC99CD|nr:amidohydrolase family protein [Ruania zhangjianzhongii]
MGTLLRHARLVTGEVVDVQLDGDVVAAVLPAGTAPAVPDGQQLDLSGYLLDTAFAEPHAHLDKVFTADRVDARGGTLQDAMTQYEAVLRAATDADVQQRARRALRSLVASGSTAVRTHVGCGRLLGVRAIESLVAVREQMADLVDLQIVAHIGGPGPEETWRQHRRRLAAALDAGADVVGGNPALDRDPSAAVQECVAVAAEAGVPLDLHIDETTDPSVATLRHLAQLAPQAGVPVTASHCVSLGAMDAGLVAEVAAEVAEANIAVVTLPATNLYLQGRSGWPRLRGLTAVDALTAAGVQVAAGGDNVRDPFNPVGRLDPLETASLLVLAGHQDTARAWQLVTGAARGVLGLPPAGPAAGARADLVAVRADSVGEAIALAPGERMVWRAGQLISRTAVDHSGPAHEGER